MRFNAMLITGLMALGLCGQTLPKGVVTPADVTYPNFASKQDVVEVQLTEKDLLEYYKAQREVDLVTNTAVIHMAQAKRDAVIVRLQAKCGDRGIVGDGGKEEFKCGEKPKVEAPKEQKK